MALYVCNVSFSLKHLGVCLQYLEETCSHPCARIPGMGGADTVPDDLVYKIMSLPYLA